MVELHVMYHLVHQIVKVAGAGGEVILLAIINFLPLMVQFRISVALLIASKIIN